MSEKPQRCRIAFVVTILLCLLTMVACSAEKRDWNRAESLHNTSSYEEFLKHHPDGKFAQEARLRIETLYFEKAQAANTVEAFQDFSKRYPDGKLAQEAQLRIESLYFEKAQAANTIEALQDFLRRYPRGQHADEIQAMLDKLFQPFSKDKLLKIPTVSPIVGKGKMSIARGNAPRTLKVSVDGTFPATDGKTCFTCAEIIQIGPHLEVPTNLFHASNLLNTGMGSGSGVTLYNFGLNGIPAAGAGEAIVSGPDGATLRKRGNGFLLVKGKANLRRASEGRH